MNALLRPAVRLAPAIIMVVVLLAPSVSAQSVIPSQIPGYICQNYSTLKTLSGPVALVVATVTLIFGIIRHHPNLVMDLVRAGLLGIVIYSLPTILSGLGLTTGCS